jgi:hypothetical protein
VEKRRKKEHKKRKKERNERKKEESRTPLSKAEKTQRQGCELNQHSTFSSPSPSSSPQRARRKEKEQRTGVAIVFSVPEAVTTGCAQKLQYRCLHPSQLPERERKKTQKTGQRRKKKGRKHRKNEKP